MIDGPQPNFVIPSANTGASLAAVQAVVGHSNPAMTRHYLHADQALVKNAVGLLPDVSHPDGKDKSTGTDGAKLDAALAALEGLGRKELEKVVARAKEMLGGG